MNHIWAYTIFSVLLVSLVSLIGLMLFRVSEKRLRQAIFILVSLAVGGLFGDVFIHLLPESFCHAQGTLSVPLLILAGIFLFFILEKFLRWRHEHTIDASHQVHPVGYMNLLADGIHNLLDGMIIGASYLSGLSVGLATTMAVLLHEIPQEIGDYGILLHAGFSKARALFFNLLSASLSFVGALLALLLGPRFADFSAAMIPLTAGGFIYIAGSDLVPELHKESKPTQSLLQILLIAFGVSMMLLLTLIE